MILPNPRDFGLSADTLKRIDRQNEEDMTLSLACIYAFGLWLGIILFLKAAENHASGEIVFPIGAITAVCGFGTILFVAQKLKRLASYLVVSSKDLANYTRYGAASDCYLAWRDLVEKQERELREREKEALRQRLGWWQSLSGQAFEMELARLLANHGYSVRRTGGPGDGGIDLHIKKYGETTIVQCKAHNREVGPGAVRDLYGSLLHYGANEAWLIASHGFTYSARKFAEGKPISLLTIEALLKHPENLR